MRRLRLTAGVALLFLLVRVPPSWKAVRAVAAGRTDFLFHATPDPLAAWGDVSTVLARWPFRAMRSLCLVRSLALFCLLKRARPGLRVVFGVRGGEAKKWDGHCWLEEGGEVLFEAEDVARYERFLVLP